MDNAALKRFMAKVSKRDDGCWEWTASLSQAGYGRFVADGRRIVNGVRVKRAGPEQAHRVAYEHFVGPIGEGLQLDHLCRNRACVNPAHLEPVTNRQNARRGARGVLVTHCANGHEYTDESTGWHGRPTGARRYCKVCQRERANARYVRRPKRTHCPNGHEYAAVGRRPNGACAECSRRSWRDWKARKVASGEWRY